MSLLPVQAMIDMINARNAPLAVLRDDANGMPAASVMTGARPSAVSDPTVSVITPFQTVTQSLGSATELYTGAGSEIPTPISSGTSNQLPNSPDVPVEPKINWMIVIFALVAIFALFYLSKK